MDLELTGKRALVTGSSRGIGRAIAEVLSEEGCRICLNARSDDALAQTALELKAASVVGDVSQPDQAREVVRQAVSQLGGLDVLVCNVGGGASVAPGEEHYDEWQRVFALNFWSATNTIEAAREALFASRGTIVCVSSIAGVEVIPGAPVTYSAAKAALNAYVRGVARALARRGVRVNAVALGNIMFKGSVWEAKNTADPAVVTAMLERDVALRRLGSAREAAELVAFCASPRSSFATGTVYTLDGGQTRS